MGTTAVMVLLASCGSDDDDLSSAPPDSTDPPLTSSTIDIVAGGLTLEVDFAEPLKAGQPVRFELTLTNQDAEAVTLQFNSGQRGDVVLSQDGAVAYQWSEGMVFTQALAEEVVGPEGSATYTLEGPMLSVEPGEYQLVASVTANPAPEPVELTVTVQG